MAEIEIMGRFPDIDPEHLAEFKAIALEAIAGVVDEAGTLRYDWFFTEDERSANLGDRLQRIIDLGGGLELSGFGEPDPELQPLAEAMGATVFLPFSAPGG